jgi:hypothetical protein
VGIAYDHHWPGSPGEFVFGSLLRVGQPSWPDTIDVRSGTEPVQERRAAA